MIGKLLESRIRQADVDQTTFATLLGVSRKRLVDMINNRRPLTEQVKETLVELFPDTTISYWTEFVEEMV